MNALDLALAGNITYSSINVADLDSPLGAVTVVSTLANTAMSRGFESILVHATANNDQNAGSETSYDTRLVYGDFYLIEAGSRLLEQQRRKSWRS